MWPAAGDAVESAVLSKKQAARGEAAFIRTLLDLGWTKVKPDSEMGAVRLDLVKSAHSIRAANRCHPVKSAIHAENGRTRGQASIGVVALRVGKSVQDGENVAIHTHLE